MQPVAERFVLDSRDSGVAMSKEGAQLHSDIRPVRLKLNFAMATHATHNLMGVVEGACCFRRGQAWGSSRGTLL